MDLKFISRKVDWPKGVVLFIISELGLPPEGLGGGRIGTPIMNNDSNLSLLEICEPQPQFKTSEQPSLYN